MSQLGQRDRYTVPAETVDIFIAQVAEEAPFLLGQRDRYIVPAQTQGQIHCQGYSGNADQAEQLDRPPLP